jgi:acyl-CoA synthetase (NDP forming)
MTINATALVQILDHAAADGRSALLEHEVYQLLEAAGCRTPRWLLLPSGEEPDAARLRDLARGGGQLMLKIVSPEIAHKTDVGGVAKVAADPAAVADGARRMLDEVPRRYARALQEGHGKPPAALAELRGAELEQAIAGQIRGVLVVERIAVEGEGPGSEVLFGLRHSREFGPVLTLGIGGVDTELLGEACRRGLAHVSASTTLVDEQGLLAAFRGTLAYQRLAGLTRGGRRLVEDEALLRVLRAFREIGAVLGTDDGSNGYTVTELEVNPFAAAGGELVALDGLLRFRRRRAAPAPRPLASLGPTLRPQSLAVVGVSSKGMNMGRIILRNVIAEGFDRQRLYVIRPGCEEIDGVRCVPDVKALPERVDVLVVAVSADQVGALMEELVEHDKAVGVILIPGGMAEKEGGAGIDERIRTAIGRGRQLGRPLAAVGGNCLGILSRPGHYHTLFIPQSKLPLPTGGKGNVAFISQSGAYMITRMSKLDWLSPRYAVSTGNQVDLTVSDFMRHIAEDVEVRTFAVYVEGFRDGDGLAFARAVREVTAQGRDVIFYKAGRTAEGKVATSGHTASLAGDYEVCEAILHQAGAYVARTFVEFLDLTKVSSLMGGKRWGGRQLAALSNAGFETVGIADGLRGDRWRLELASLSPATRQQLAASLAKGHLDTLIDVRNPLDLTPMATDEAHEDVVRAFFADPGVDLVLCATVPLTPAMATLAEGVPEEDSIRGLKSLVNRLGRIVPQLDKPLVVCFDSGPLYDPLAHAIEEIGVPVFRSADDAVRVMGLYLEGRLARR